MTRFYVRRNAAVAKPVAEKTSASSNDRISATILTAAELAARLGVSRSTIANWERLGKIASPAYDENGHKVYNSRAVQAIERFASTR